MRLTINHTNFFENKELPHLLTLNTCNFLYYLCTTELKTQLSNYVLICNRVLKQKLCSEPKLQKKTASFAYTEYMYIVTSHPRRRGRDVDGNGKNVYERLETSPLGWMYTVPRMVCPYCS